MEEEPNYEFKDHIMGIKGKYDDLSQSEPNLNLFISSYSNYKNSAIEECEKQPPISNFSLSITNLGIDMEEFEKNFSTVFQTSHESDEYSAAFVRLLYLKYLSTQLPQIENSPFAEPTIKQEMKDDDSIQNDKPITDVVIRLKKEIKLYKNSNNRIRKIKNIPISSKGVFTAHLMSNGKLGLGSWSNSIYFYDPTTEKTTELPGHTRWVKYVIQLDNDRIASCSEDSTLRIWNSKTLECLDVFKADFATEGLMSITQLSTDKILCGSSDGFLFIWDIKNHIILDSIQGSDSGIFVIMVINKNQLMIGSFDNIISIFKIEPNLAKIGKLEGHSGWAKPLLKLKQNDLITTGEDGVIKLWNLESLECYQTLYGHKDGIWSGFLKNNDTILFTGSADCTIRIWDLITNQCITIISERSTVTSLIELPDNRLIAGTFENELSLYMIE